MNSKNKNILIELTVIVTLLVIGLGGFVVFDKVLSNDDKKTEVTNVNNDVLLNQYEEKIIDGFWYNNGYVFNFENGNTSFYLGKYASGLSYGGNVKTYKVSTLGSKKYKIEIEVIGDACTTNNCLIMNAYILNVELEYDGNSANEITLTKMTITENNATKDYDSLEGVYSFAGNTDDEVLNYINSINSK